MRINRQQCSALQFLLHLAQRGDYMRTDHIGENVVGANLNHTRAVFTAAGKRYAEVQILREDDVPHGSRKVENLLVCGIRSSDLNPMNSLEARPRDCDLPLRRQAHVQENLHPSVSTTSRSCASEAAYRTAWRMSSRSRYGYASRISSMLCPEPTSPTTTPTVTRIPRMHGFPPITAGFRVMRSKSSIGSLMQQYLTPSPIPETKC